MPQPGAPATGALLAVTAYLTWGLVALYWRALGHVPPVEVLAHRVLWTAVLLGFVTLVTRGFGRLRAALAWPTLRALLASAALITVNWGLFLWAVQAGRLLEASLGYYVNPLANVALGVVVLKERLRPAQKAAVALATVAVVVLSLGTGAPPWLSLALAGTFGIYGLLRKLAPVDAATGLFVETLVGLPFAAALIAIRESVGAGTLSTGTPGHAGLVALSGIVTAVPLLCFTGAARRLPLSTLGFFQYISPTCQLLIAVLVFGEPLSGIRAAAFGLVWAAVLVFSVDGWRAGRADRVAAARPAPEIDSR